MGIFMPDVFPTLMNFSIYLTAFCHAIGLDRPHKPFINATMFIWGFHDVSEEGLPARSQFKFRLSQNCLYSPPPVFLDT